MKKLLCLIIIATLVVGCSSSSPKEEKKEDTKESDDKKAETNNQEEAKANEVTSSTTKKNNRDTKQPSVGDSSSNSGSNTGGNTTSTNQEAPTLPKEVTPSPTPPEPATPTEHRNKADSVMAQINVYRQQNGLSPFIPEHYLLNSSSNHAYAMAEKRALWHSGAAECITNYDDPFSAWKNSPSHNDMLLNNNRYGAVSIYYVDGYYFSVFHTSP